MTTREQERERLLGYLLHALDDHEAAQVRRELSRQPRLRDELATLQQELAPLNYLADPPCPPPLLASRTCAKIWNTMDNENFFDKDIDRENGKEKGKLDSPPTVDSVLGFIPDPFKTVVAMPAVDLELPRIRRDVKTTPKTPPKSSRSHWLGLIVSASIGIVVAFFVFPMIRYAERSTRSYVTDSWMTEIHRRVDQYEQIYSGPNGVPRVEEILPVNLALYSWQELHSDAHSKSLLLYESKPITPKEPSEASRSTTEDVPGQSAILLTGFDSEDSPIPWDAGGQSGHMLLSLPGQESSVRTALGQDILIRDGRVFFRILPGSESPKK